MAATKNVYLNVVLVDIIFTFLTETGSRCKLNYFFDLYMSEKAYAE